MGDVSAHIQLDATASSLNFFDAFLHRWNTAKIFADTEDPIGAVRAVTTCIIEGCRVVYTAQRVPKYRNVSGWSDCGLPAPGSGSSHHMAHSIISTSVL
jgi:hypothetical protein